MTGSRSPFNDHIPPGNRLPRRRGVTLLEVVVATAIGVAAAGVILDIFIQSNRQADAGMRKDRLVQQAGASLRILGARLERARAAEPAAEEVFKLDQIKIASLDPVSGERGVFEARIEPTGKNDAAYQSLWRWTGPAKDSPQDSSSWRPFGDDGEQPVKAFFRYAWAFKGLTPLWNPDTTPAGRPRVVEITVVAQDLRGRAAPVRLTTAVALP